MPTRLVVGSDSTIAVAVVSKGYSTCSKTREEVKEIYKICKEKNYILEVIWIPGEENAADPVSRGHDADPTLNEATWHLLHGKTPEKRRVGRPVPLMTESADLGTDDENDYSYDPEGQLLTDLSVMEQWVHSAE